MLLCCLSRAASLGFVLSAALCAQTAADFFHLGSNQFNDRQFADARISFARAIALDAKYAEAYRALGMTDLELKDYQSAYRDWLKAVDLLPSDEKSKYFLGRLFYEANLPNEAAAWLREALQLSPGDYEARTYLGLCAEALGFDETAERLYRRAIQESEDDRKPYAWAFLSLGNYLQKHGNQAGALAVFEQGAKECPEPHELSALGELLSLRSQPEEAERALRQAIALDPTLSQPHYRLGLLLKSLGRSDEARTEMAKFQTAKEMEAKAPKIMALQK